jgi:iron complex outermembrane receptor protein
VELNTRPWRDTVLSLSGAYIDSTFADFKNVNCYLGQPILPLGTPRTSDRQCILVSPTQALTNADGLPLPGQPKWTLNADLRQSWEVDSLRIDAGLTWSWRSKVNFSTNDDPNTIQGAYGLLGGNLSVGPQNNKWRLTVFARNLLEKRFVSVIFPSPVLAAAGDYAQYQTPDSNRIIGAGFNVKF